ncbi:response regulator [Crassaminicella indica]|uniref:Response regulator n=1 Tax=Crassaminicella indica TaxID=2855394 RepID=A0ABX8RBR3_9CLOT|nr:response regulator [Crassaminicella indica]QXM06499.1 response regulator [Crassaminicella indica]
MKNNTVLFVDDDTHIINSLRRGLFDEPYGKEFAYSGEEALKIMENNTISVIVTDMKMPKMNGLTLLKIISEKYPNVVKIVLSGYTQIPQVLATINQVNIFKFIAKPWNLDNELIPIIRQAIEYYNLTLEREKMKAEIERKNTLYTQILKSSNEKFSVMHKDYENIRMIDQSIFHYLKNQFMKKDAILFQYTLDFIEEMHAKYMNTLPTVTINFDLEKVITEINSYISQSYSNPPIEIHQKTESNIQFHGNYKLLITFLEHFIKHALNHYHQLNFTIFTEPTKDATKLFFIIELLENISPKNNFLSLIPLLNEFCQIINGKFEIIKEDTNYKVLSLQIEYHFTQNNNSTK